MSAEKSFKLWSKLFGFDRSTFSAGTDDVWREGLVGDERLVIVCFRNQLLADYLMSLETSDGWLEEVGVQVLSSGAYTSPLSVTQSINSVTSNDVVKVSHMILLCLSQEIYIFLIFSNRRLFDYEGILQHTITTKPSRKRVLKPKLKLFV